MKQEQFRQRYSTFKSLFYGQEIFVSDTSRFINGEAVKALVFCMCESMTITVCVLGKRKCSLMSYAVKMLAHTTQSQPLFYAQTLHSTVSVGSCTISVKYCILLNVSCFTSNCIRRCTTLSSIQLYYSTVKRILIEK